MAQTLVGLYNTRTDAERVAQELAEHGFSRHDILLASHQADSRRSHDTDVREWVSADASRDLIERLTDLGVPTDEARAYAEDIRRGGALVVMEASNDVADRGLEIMNRMQPVDSDERVALWRQEEWTGVNANTAPYTSTEIRCDADPNTGPYTASRRHAYATEERVVASARAATAAATIDCSAYDADYRKHHETALMGSGSYVDYEVAYRYGYDLGIDARYRGRNWAELEPDFRRDWEVRQPGTWEQFQEAIHYGWDRVRLQT